MFFLDLGFDPAVLMAMWAAGVAAAGAAVAGWRIVGPGYTRLASGTVVLLGGAAWFFESGPVPALGVLAGIGGGLAVRRPAAAAGLLGASGLLFLLGASGPGLSLTAVTGAAALGGITGEMLLGHWYLVSPRMPRWALRRLAAAGGIGVGLDTAAVFIIGAPSGAAAFVLPALGGMSVLLMIGVWFSLDHPSYSGVMAATGLSYLAVLTCLGSAALGRAAAGGSGLLG